MSGIRKRDELQWWLSWTQRAARAALSRSRAGVADRLTEAAHRLDPRGQPTEMRLVQNLNGPSHLWVNGVLTFTGRAEIERAS